jgi:hypothetical protein
VGFSKKSRRFDETRPRPRVSPSPVSASELARTILFGVLVAIAAAWGLARHCTRPIEPLRVPAAPAAAPTYDADAGEIPVPDTIDTADN